MGAAAVWNAASNPDKIAYIGQRHPLLTLCHWDPELFELKIPVWILANFQCMQWHLRQATEKTTTSRDIITKFIAGNSFFFYFPLWISGLTVKFFTFRKFKNYRIFFKLSQEISALYVPFQNYRKFWWMETPLMSLKICTVTHFFRPWNLVSRFTFLATSGQ